MLVSIDWCISNMSKAYRIHSFEGTFYQFTQVIFKAKELGIDYTKNIPEDLINNILTQTK